MGIRVLVEAWVFEDGVDEASDLYAGGWLVASPVDVVLPGLSAEVDVFWCFHCVVILIGVSVVSGMLWA